jgi:LuxR family maltose regulon positive regulatory protein
MLYLMAEPLPDNPRALMPQVPLVKTKLHVPALRTELVPRPRLIERLNAGLSEDGFTRKLTLVSAPPGFGKATLVSEWVTGCSQRAAWLSLDERDNDPGRFLVYLVAALQTIDESLGHGAMAVLQSPGMVNIEVILTSLVYNTHMTFARAGCPGDNQTVRHGPDCGHTGQV